jgi:peptide/nickel transport system substrate-binding protein
VYAGLPVVNYNQLAADKGFRADYNLYAPESYDFTYWGINGRLAKFADARTRQALACLLDVDLIIKATQSGFATRTVGPVIPSNPNFYNTALRPYQFDLPKATALLTAAGWQKKNNGWQKQQNGQWEPLTITLNYKAGNTELQNISLIFQQAAAKIGIPVRVEPLEGLLLNKNLQTHNFEMFIRYYTGNPFVYNYKPILHTENAAEGGGNYTGFGTPESDRLIDLINTSPNVRQKAGLIKRFQEILHEQSNLIFLYSIKERIAVSKRFTNTKVSDLKPGYDVSAFTLKD